MSAHEEQLPTVQLDAFMPNGAKVSDWLGTAMTAARVGARTLDEVREKETRGYEAWVALGEAEDEFEQALGEVRAVLARLRDLQGGEAG